MQNKRATRLLGEDHQNVRALQQQLGRDRDQDQALVKDLLHDLEVHAYVEERLVYPALQRRVPDDPLVQDLARAHADLRQRISAVRLAEDPGANPALSEPLEGLLQAFLAHAEQEETQAFPLLARDAVLDTELGAALAPLRSKLRMLAPVVVRADIEVPRRRAYDQWTQFEAFPRFLPDLKEVRQLDDTHVLWRASVAGRSLEFSTEIYEQIPDERIAWTSLAGAAHAGAVSFEDLGRGRCRMLVEITYEPQGVVEDVGAWLGLVARQVERDLGRFKQFIETRKEETGGWRGRVEGVPLAPPPPTPEP